MRIVATYEFQNQIQEVVSTGWILNGAPIIPSVSSTTSTINGVLYNSYSFQLNGISGYVRQAVDSNQEILQVSGLSVQSNSSITFIVRLIGYQ